MNLKFIIRKAIKNKRNNVISLFGLVIAFALAIVLLLYVQNEYSFDKFHFQKDYIYRVVDKESNKAFSGPKLAEEIKNSIPGIKDVMRVRHNGTCVLTYNGMPHTVHWNMLLDSTLLSMFNYPMVMGNKTTALSNPFSVVLTESTARQIFGTENPIGKVISFNNQWDHVVTGVLKDIPHNTTLNIDVVFPFHAIEYHWKSGKNDEYNVLESPFNKSFHTYLLLDKGANKTLVENKISALHKEIYNNEVYLQKLEDIYFDVNPVDRWLKKGNKSIVTILFSIAIGLIVISIFNFINLYSASVTDSIPSMILRKINGSGSMRLVQQVIFENFIFISVSLIMAIVISSAIIPLFNQIFNTQIILSLLLSKNNIFIVAGVFVLLVFICCLYPLWIIMHKLNIDAVKNASDNQPGTFGLRNALITGQYIFTTIFIIAALTVSKQGHFIRSQNLGFNSEQLLYIETNNDDNIKSELIKSELLKNPHIKKVSLSAGLFGDVRRGSSVIIDGEYVQFNRIYTDKDYIPTLGYELVAGRNFSLEYPTDYEKHAYIINETMANACKWEQPLDEHLDGGRIVGIVKDFHINSFHSPITPLAFVCYPERAKWVFNIRIDGNNIKGTMNYIQQVWEKTGPEFPLKITFADERINSYYNEERKFSILTIVMAMVCIFLSCIGLIGVVISNLQKRIKEIGVRKVNGARVFDILRILNSGFVQWILISFFIACPLALYIMNKWLNSFAYKTPLSWWIFAVAGVALLLISVVTISLQSYRTAIKNPVEALRYE